MNNILSSLERQQSLTLYQFMKFYKYVEKQGI